MRGTSCLKPLTEGLLGIIPAGAGHFELDQAFQGSGRDHPRRCGALEVSDAVVPIVAGSSPQVRGTSELPNLLRLSGGIIPAGAGHFGGVQTNDLQVRGTCFIGSSCVDRVGIIPAGAGHLQISEIEQFQAWDHPRRCGALKFTCSSSAQARGSSPQVRGTFCLNLPGSALGGIIPAGAGHFTGCTLLLWPR